MSKKDFSNPKYYTNRELSWILFDHRVLNEARDKTIPLFERLKFLSITASNLDEFFMIRVASLKDMADLGYGKQDISGLTPVQQLELLSQAIHALVERQYSTYNRSLVPKLAQNGLQIVRQHEELTKEETLYIDRYFEENIYPVLTPMAVDSSRPFPLVRNKTLNIGAMVHKKSSKEELEFAMVQVPSVLDRVVVLPTEGKAKRIILLEEIIERNIDKLFLNYDIICAHPFRIMRNADLTIEEDEAADLLKEIEKQLKKRQWGAAIRLEVEHGCDRRLLRFLTEELRMQEQNIYEIDGPLDLTVLMKIYALDGFEHLKTPKYTPQAVPELPAGCNLFEEIRKKDILLHHPYQTFEPVVNFIRQAAKDPEVLAIKQTLYRVSGNSPIIAALAQAAENGKQVTVLVELKARFDEENNIVWAKMLEKAGCHVIYGLVGLKTHSKITLVVRRESDGIRRYVHLGTGNYNDATAKLYTDIGLLTCSESIGEDATAVFNMLSGYSEPLFWNKLSLAPLWLKDKFLTLIQREKQFAQEGRTAHIIAKMNSLCDRDIIAALYEASSVGVKIELIVRGICSLKVGIKGVSENITVRSIVGNFLEHSRIFYFENGGDYEIYCGSADWMPRNLERRVEILFPIDRSELKNKLMHILECQLKDNVKASVLQEDGAYVKVDKRGKSLFQSQEVFCREALEAARAASKENPLAARTFIPETHQK
ncbi:MAG: RNA degradosome polyphosphate kinase [Eubacterium sp.]|nr:RNA degradosome polyphosphate kinase [Eubacterium sp.]MCM1214678.1 RNA degradosome polyphosphate kinase [Lachnospiraceae bacterium]MCM1304967.1 RNA degradosome polyphosphate kinase [Butyrivibrio sp.]MCM1344500.1 RNA degradosome polyphosphate kinase [Muribaculaceae bacterium]MCM1239499.1 RNA degradosome polyphosphate kinase [Lachnospiraceae bacterium]